MYFILPSAAAAAETWVLLLWLVAFADPELNCDKKTSVRPAPCKSTKPKLPDTEFTRGRQRPYIQRK